jgi:hypothetical protein
MGLFEEHLHVTAVCLWQEPTAGLSVQNRHAICGSCIMEKPTFQVTYVGLG